MPLQAPRLTHDSIGIHPRINELFALALAATLLSGLAAFPQRAAATVTSSDRIDGQTAAQLGVPRAAFPDVSMKSGALVTSDGRVLWSRRADSERALASITKLMTAVVAMEQAEPESIVTVGRESLRVGESTSFLRLGQKLKLSELLEALLIKSGNDAAVAIARHVSGSEDEFVKQMNAKAAELGLSHTRFANAHGLDEPGHYSTAHDLALLSRYAMSKPEFRSIVKKKRARVGSGRSAIKIENTNLLVGNYAGANGIKTGFTTDAGYSLIGSARRTNIELIAVVLGTGSDAKRVRDARALLDFGFAHFRPQRLASARTVIGEAPVSDYLDVTVPAAVASDTVVPVLDFAGPITRTVDVAAVEAPVHQGDKVGVATFIQDGDVIATVSLHATRNVEKPNVLLRIGILFARAWRGLTGTT